MISTAELLAAAKSARGIPSNYRLAKVLEATDATLQRWNTGRGCPDDSHAAKLAVMAGLDVEWVVASMRAQREKDPELRAIWARTADRLLLTSGMPPRPDDQGPPTSGNDPESGVGEGGTGGAKTGTLMSMDESHIMRRSSVFGPTRRQARIALANALRALRKARAH